jgi:hypothetical protein
MGSLDLPSAYNKHKDKNYGPYNKELPLELYDSRSVTDRERQDNRLHIEQLRRQLQKIKRKERLREERCQALAEKARRDELRRQRRIARQELAADLGRIASDTEDEDGDIEMADA